MSSQELAEVPGYRVISLAGSGSRSTVYKARCLSSERLVALKVLSADHSLSNPDLCERLRASIAALEALDAPSVVRPLSLAAIPGSQRIALAMDFVEGDSVARALQRGVRFPPKQVAEIAEAVVRALAPAAKHGLHHGALHGGKVLLSPSGAKLIGLGLGESLSKDFENIETAGRQSPHTYADNEMLSGQEPDSASDVFSLGALLYHLLTGIPPYKARSLPALRVERADGPLVWPRGAADEFGAPLVRLIDRMTSTDRARRPALDDALASALRSSAKRRKTPPPIMREEPPPGPALVLIEPAEPQGVASARRVAAAVGGALDSTAARWAMSIVTVGALLAAIGFALRVPSETPQDAGANDGHRAQPDMLATQTRSDPEPDLPRAEPAETADDAAVAELRAMELAAVENDAELEALVPRLNELASAAGDVGLRASALLLKVRAKQVSRADEALARSLDRAASLEAAGKYGAALAATEEFPAEMFAGMPAVDRAKLEADALRGRAARAYAGAASEAELLAAKGDFAGAQGLYRSIRDTMGMPTWTERAEQAMIDLGRREEHLAAANRTKRAAEEARLVHEEFEREMREVTRSCTAYSYTTAEQKLKELSVKALSQEDRVRLRAYADLVGREAAQFRLVGSRVRSGTRQGFLNFVNSPKALIIRDVTEDGLELSGLSSKDGTLRSRLSWSRLPTSEAFKVMLDVGSGNELMILEERLALAVFAHHRGLAAERENELSVADRLAQTRRDRALVERIRETLLTIKVDR